MIPESTLEPTVFAAELQLRSGQTVRVSPDEKLVGDRPVSIDFDTQMPGGFGTATVTISRAADLASDDRLSNARIRVYDSDGDKLAFKGIVRRASQDGVDKIKLECVGLIVLLDLNRAYRWLFIHQRMSAWRGMSPARQLFLTAAGTDPSDGQISPSPSDGAPAAKLSLTGEWSRAQQCELWFDTPVPIGRWYAAWETNAAIVFPDANWSFIMGMGNDDEAVSGELTENITGAGANSNSFDGTGDQHRARIRLRHGAAGGADGVEYAMFFGALAVYGPQNLEPVGVDTATLGAPLIARDIIIAALRDAAPDVEVDEMMITDSGLPVYHCANFEPSTVRSLIEDLTARGSADFEIPDWGYYERFFWMPPGSYGRTWVVSREQAADITAEGPDTENRVGGVFVTYSDAAGTRFTAGPPGSGADHETDELVDTEVANPGTAFQKNWITHDAGITSDEGAIAAGIVKMRDLNRLRWKGSLVIQGQIRDSAGNWHQPWEVWSGDQIVIEDEVDLDPIPIEQSSFTNGSYDVKIDVGEPDDGQADVLGIQLSEANERVGVG